MIERLDFIENKYNELNKELTKEDVVNDLKKIKEISKNISSLEEVVNKYKEYKKLLSDIDDLKEMMKDSELSEMAEIELESKKQEKIDMESTLEILLLPKDENDDKNVIMQIRGAAGGDEANIFAGDLYRMYCKYADKCGFSHEIFSANETDLGGFTLVEFIIKGHGAYSKLKYESGSHRVQRVPVTESNGRLQTSTATVLVMPEQDDDIDIQIDDKDIRIDIYRSSGKGGQGVNTTDSAVRITHLPTGIVVTCQNERSQIQNKAQAMKVLKSRLYDLQQEEKDKQEGNERRSKIGTGDRAEKIRTYNYPQNRITDHRIGFSIQSLDRVMDGEMDPIIDALTQEDQKRKLEELQ